MPDDTDPIFYEKPKSRSGHLDSTGRTLTRNYFCARVEDEDEVLTIARANIPRVYRGLLLKSITANNLYLDCWDVDAEYGIGKPSGISPDTFSLKIGTQSVHINQGLESIFRRRKNDNALVTPVEPVLPNRDDFAPGEVGDAEYTAALVAYTEALEAYPAALEAYKGTAADHKNAIGVTAEDVAGCDILVPKMEWSKSVTRSELSFAYVITLFNLVGKTNDQTFYGFPPGTLLYLGAEPTTGQSQLADGTEFPIWTLSHQFAYERHRLNIDIGGILIPQKKGWEYLWVHFGLVPAAGGMTQPPDAVYVDRVYEPGNYELLEIGTDF